MVLPQQAQLKSELDDLRKKLSGAEAKAREAWEEVEKHADGNEEVHRKLERTASEVWVEGVQCVCLCWSGIGNSKTLEIKIKPTIIKMNGEIFLPRWTNIIISQNKVLQ